MSRPSFDVKSIYTGTGSLAAYTFDFKITDLSQILIIEVDDDGVETQRVRGDDNVYLDEVEFDAIQGGGTVTLAANLPADYQLIILLADDAPVQEYTFRNNTSFTLRRFEDALDAIVGAVQRLAYRAKQSLRIHDLDDEDAINTQLPPGFADNAERVIIVNSDGDGFEFGPTSDEIANAQGYAEAAAQSAVEAGQLQGEHRGSNFTAEYGKLYLITGALSVQLPAPVEFGVVRFKKTGAANLTLLRDGSEDIDGVAADYINTSTKAAVTLYTDGTDWFLL